MNYEDRIEQISDEKYLYFQRVKDAEAKLRMHWKPLKTSRLR